MTTRRDIRTLALQALYQLDARPGEPVDEVRASVHEAPLEPEARETALAMALGAWTCREKADALAADLAPDWPSARQPAVDRAIVRLAWYEMTAGDIPAKVAINEAVELAKTFSTDRSAPFINGVLDKMMRRIDPPNAASRTPRRDADGLIC